MQETAHANVIMHNDFAADISTCLYGRPRLHQCPSRPCRVCRNCIFALKQISSSAQLAGTPGVLVADKTKKKTLQQHFWIPFHFPFTGFVSACATSPDVSVSRCCLTTAAPPPGRVYGRACACACRVHARVCLTLCSSPLCSHSPCIWF